MSTCQKILTNSFHGVSAYGQNVVRKKKKGGHEVQLSVSLVFIATDAQQCRICLFCAVRGDIIFAPVLQ